MIRSVLLGAVSAVALTASAQAADIYRAPEGAGGYKDSYVPVNTWTGFYAGVNGGYGWDASGIGDKLSTLGFDIKPEGGFGGGQIGYNWQGGFGYHHLVLGVEADFQGADISDEVSLTNGIATAKVKSTLDWFGTVRGRLGYAFDRTLVYATGGFAYGNITDEVSISAIRLGSFGAKQETTSTGYVVGGGIEHKINPSWSIKGEYQYINLGQDSGWASVTKEDYELHTVRVGLNYHIGGNTYEPLK